MTTENVSALKMKNKVPFSMKSAVVTMHVQYTTNTSVTRTRSLASGANPDRISSLQSTMVAVTESKLIRIDLGEYVSHNRDTLIAIVFIPIGPDRD